MYQTLKKLISNKLSYVFNQLAHNKKILVKGSVLDPYKHPSYSEEQTIRILINKAEYEKESVKIKCMYKA